ncbi:MAG: HAD family hydrolase [Muribaculaceae bacterium]|nr:HAD family hydrolase [Muribaculaceae bacterium]
MKKLVIFDLDGTLLNTIADLGSACNHALAAMRFPTHDLNQYPFMVGNGITRLIERALPPEHRNKTTVMATREHFLAYYESHCTDLTRPYDGIDNLLQQLVDNGIGVAVASNKYHAGVTKLIGHFFADIPWIAVEGQRGDRPTKPNPAIVNDILAVTGVSTADVLYVGDSGVDMDTARNAGFESVGVTWGFRPESELLEHSALHIVTQASEILPLALGDTQPNC